MEQEHEPSPSSDPSHVAEPSSIEPENPLVSYVRHRINVANADAKCPICGVNTWMLLDGGDLHTAVFTVTLRSFSTYSLACGHCGFVRQHIREILDADQKV
jgi:hypothetical protein